MKFATGLRSRRGKSLYSPFMSSERRGCSRGSSAGAPSAWPAGSRSCRGGSRGGGGGAEGRSSSRGSRTSLSSILHAASLEGGSSNKESSGLPLYWISCIPGKDKIRSWVTGAVLEPWLIQLHPYPRHVTKKERPGLCPKELPNLEPLQKAEALSNIYKGEGISFPPTSKKHLQEGFRFISRHAGRDKTTECHLSRTGHASQSAFRWEILSGRPTIILVHSGRSNPSSPNKSPNVLDCNVQHPPPSCRQCQLNDGAMGISP